MSLLTINGLTVEQLAFARAVAGEVDRLRARVAELEAENAEFKDRLEDARWEAIERDERDY